MPLRPRLGHLRAPGVERDEDREFAEGLEDWLHPLDLLGLGHPVALLAGAHAAHVDDVDALLDHLLRALDGGLGVGVAGRSVERIGGAVDDAHHRGPGGVEALAPEDQWCGRGEHVWAQPAAGTWRATAVIGPTVTCTLPSFTSNSCAQSVTTSQ